MLDSCCRTGTSRARIICRPQPSKGRRATPARQSRAASCYTTASSAAALGHLGAVHKRGSGAKTARSRRPSLNDKDEVLLEPGTALQSLFIIGNGVVSLTRDEIEGEMEIMRLGPGDHFGEIGLLTGALAMGKIVALTPAVVYELAKADLTPMLEARPQVAQELCRALARRQAAGRLTASADLDKTVPRLQLTSWFSERLHKLFDLANAE